MSAADGRRRVVDTAAAETGMNLTPMIDVTFQLIVFFMLTLEFRPLEHRIEAALPKPFGPNLTPVLREDRFPVVAKLMVDRNPASGTRETMVRVGPGPTVRLPAEAVARERALDRVQALVEESRERLGEAWLAKGEIRTPPPTGNSVPHGDVVAVLDRFLAAGIEDIAFEGTPERRP